MRNTGKVSKFIFVGNHLCLDFINTQIIHKGRIVDLLRDFSHLVEWLEETEVLDLTKAKETLGKLAGNPEGERVLEQAREFRAVLRAIIERIIEGKPIQKSAIDAINKLLSNRIGYPQLVQVRDGFKTQFYAESSEAMHLIVPIAASASDFLSHGNFSLIKRCDNPDCILYFYDVSKNHARRWCSMNICGNRMKVAAHYRRHRDM
jgi:predicted RNA-binding Zn ribbon-like protein